MKYLLFFLTLIIILILIYIVYSYNYNVNYRKIDFYMNKYYKNNKTRVRKTPKILIQTYHNKSKIPNKVYKNIEKYAPNYEHLVYDDEDCINFLKTNYNSLIVNKFNNFKKGAHKADLFRYCWLYKNGGVYMDIKIKLIKPLSEILTEENKLYTVLSDFKGTIFQGIISTPPNNPVFKILINKLLNTHNLVIMTDYLIFTRHFYDELLYTDNSKYKLFKERCSDELNKDLKPDRYNKKCAIYDQDERIFITRYSDYPW